MTAPFRPGELILLARDPHEARIVVSCEPYASSPIEYCVRCRTQGYEFGGHTDLGVMTEIAPATSYIAAPADWRDAPVLPNGYAASGLSHEAWEQKRRNDNADRDHQLALVLWAEQTIAWAHECLAGIDPGAAVAEERSAAIMLLRARARLRGEDPDAAPVGRAA
ncbi:MAG TPA: hypothetical protein VHW66_19145 [Stellaceae bacterium]|nr:hypothetical protein [Stellaceae bacterium]